MWTVSEVGNFLQVSKISLESQNVYLLHYCPIGGIRGGGIALMNL